jgi:hypothetical protein
MFITISQHSTGSLRAMREDEEIKGVQKRKEEVKQFLFTDDITLYTEKLSTLAKTFRTYKQIE